MRKRYTYFVWSHDDRLKGIDSEYNQTKCGLPKQAIYFSQLRKQEMLLDAQSRRAVAFCEKMRPFVLRTKWDTLSER